MAPNQIMLFGLSVDEAVPADSDVRALSEVMDNLDWARVESGYFETGCPAYPPRVLAKILAYAYSKGVRSSRKIEELVENDKRYIWLAGGLRPDHNTLARFRKSRWSELLGLYGDTVRVSCELGLVFLRVVSEDGSKIRAAASTKSVYGESRVSRELAVVEKVMREAEEVDRAEDEQYGQSNGRELPDHLKDAAKRKQKLEEIGQKLKESKKSAIVTSEPESRVMMSRDGKLPCYNLQAAVDAESQIIVGVRLTQSETDHGGLAGIIAEVESNTGLSPGVSLADSGFSDEETLKWLDESGREALIPIQEQPQSAKRNDLFCSKCFVLDESKDVVICPAGRELAYTLTTRTDSGTYRVYAAKGCKSCSFQKECVGSTKGSKRIRINEIENLREQMRQKLKSEEGQALFALRKQTVEPVFGQIKTNLGFDRLLLRGFEGALAEVALICMVHNLLKCVRKARSMANAAAAAARLGFVLALAGRPGRMLLPGSQPSYAYR